MHLKRGALRVENGAGNARFRQHGRSTKRLGAPASGKVQGPLHVRHTCKHFFHLIPCLVSDVLNFPSTWLDIVRGIVHASTIFALHMLNVLPSQFSNACCWNREGDAISILLLRLLQHYCRLGRGGYPFTEVSEQQAGKTCC